MESQEDSFFPADGHQTILNKKIVYVYLSYLI